MAVTIPRTWVDKALRGAKAHTSTEVTTAHEGDLLAVRIDPRDLERFVYHLLLVAVAAKATSECQSALKEHRQTPASLYPEGPRTQVTWPKVRVTRG